VRTVDAQCAVAESPFLKAAPSKPKVEPSHRGAPWK